MISKLSVSFGLTNGAEWIFGALDCRTKLCRYIEHNLIDSKDSSYHTLLKTMYCWVSWVLNIARALLIFNQATISAENLFEAMQQR